MKVSRDRVFLLILGAGAILCFVVVAVTYVTHFGSKFSPDHQRWGEFGEYLGGVLGPVFSLAAFIGVLWTIGLQLRTQKEARQQQVEDTFFRLLERFARIRNTPTYFTSVKDGEALTVLPLVLASDAWKEWRALMNKRTETTVARALAHFSDAATELIKSRYNNITQLTNELMRLYAFVYHANIPDLKKLQYVQYINGEAATIETSLLLVTLMNQPRGSPAFVIVNTLRAFEGIDLNTSLKIPSEVYRTALQLTFPHLAPEGVRPVMPL